MYQEYHKAFTEVYEILNLMSHQLQDKIPNEFYEMIEDEFESLTTDFEI